MALTDQPYLPLYVADWLTNSKLKLCSAKAHGIMINTMCLMHKEGRYGTILLKQKFKQNDKQNTKQNGKQINNFAYMLAKLLPFEFADVELGLAELVDEEVLKIEGDLLICNRMVRDAELSKKRALSGQKGGKSGKRSRKTNEDFAIANIQANGKANMEANTAYAIANILLIDRLKKNSEIFNDIQSKTGLEGERLDELLKEWELYYKNRFDNWQERNDWELRSSAINFIETKKTKQTHAGTGNRNWQ